MRTFTSSTQRWGTMSTWIQPPFVNSDVIVKLTFHTARPSCSGTQKERTLPTGATRARSFRVCLPFVNSCLSNDA
jgi:hypothetical protein